MRNFEFWVFSYLLNSLWQVPLLYGAGWVAARVLRRVGPSTEHRAWVAVLMAQAVLPACAILPWGWATALLTWGTSSHYGVQPGVSIVIDAGSEGSGLHLTTGLCASVLFTYAAVLMYFAARFGYRCIEIRRIFTGARELKLSTEATCEWDRCARMYGVRRASAASSSRVVWSPHRWDREQGIAISAASIG